MTAPNRSARKIRDAELRKIPFMLVVGDREQEAGEVGRARAPPGRRRLGPAAADAFVASRVQSSSASRGLHARDPGIVRPSDGYT